MEKGSRFMKENGSIPDDTREAIASYFNGYPQLTALTPNFTVGLNAIMEGFSAKTKVLLLQNDYPSVNFAVESRDFSIAYARLDDQLEDNIAKVFRENQPDVFVFSLVQYINGIKIHLDFLKDLKEEFPETLIIADGTQYLGTEKFDFKASGIDILGSSGYKWMTAGFGNGFFMFKPRIADKIHPNLHGFGSNIGRYKEEGGTLIGKLEGGHMDNVNVGSVKVALDLHKQIGADTIEKQVTTLSKAAKSAFEDLNLLDGSVTKRKTHSSLFNLKGGDKRFQKLEKNDVLTSQRGPGIRVGFHFYNTMDDLDKLIEVLKD